MAEIPPSIFEPLGVLSAHPGYASIFRAHVDQLSMYVVRAYLQLPPDATILAKALRIVDKCARAAEAAPPTAPEAAARETLALVGAAIEAARARPAPVARTLMMPPETGAPASPAPHRAPPVVAAAIEPEAYVAPAIPRFEFVSPPRAAPPPVAAPVPSPAPRAAPARADADSGRRNLVATMAKLRELFERRDLLRADLLAPWGELAAIDLSLRRAMRTLGWLGTEGRELAEGAFAEADEAATAFAAAFALMIDGGVDVVLARLASDGAAARGARLAFEHAADAAALDRLEALALSVDGARRAPLVRLLAARGRRSPDQLVALLDDASDEVATHAAQLLRWIGRAPVDLEELRARLPHVSPGRRAALLSAAVALGSVEALRELRGALDAQEPVTEPVVDALAIAGGPSDAARLLGLATRQPELAPLAVLAAGHLGDPAVAGALARAEVDEAVSEAVSARALRTIFGAASPSEAASPGRRLLYGAPWTLAGARARLAAPDELARARPWFALELAVRAGRRPQPPLAPTTATSIPEAMMDQLAAAEPSRGVALADGTWHYLGRSVT